MRFPGLSIALVPFMLSGCMVLMAVPPMIDEYAYSRPPTSGVESYRIRHFLDPAARRRYIVVDVGGRRFKSGSEDFSSAISAARTACGPACEASTEADVRARLGPPNAT